MLGSGLSLAGLALPEEAVTLLSCPGKGVADSVRSRGDVLLTSVGAVGAVLADPVVSDELPLLSASPGNVFSTLASPVSEEAIVVTAAVSVGSGEMFASAETPLCYTLPGSARLGCASASCEELTVSRVEVRGSSASGTTGSGGEALSAGMRSG